MQQKTAMTQTAAATTATAITNNNNIIMKTKRIINAVCWAVLAVAIITSVCIEWSRQDCGAGSVVLASALYLLFCGGFGYMIDEAIRNR